MVDPEIITRRLQKLEELLRGLEPMRALSREAFLDDPQQQAVAERWLHLAAECVLDCCHHLIADEKWRQPTSFRDTIVVLVENGVLDPALGGELQQMAGLRNVLVHLYLIIDHEIVFDVLQTKLDVFRAFAAQVQSFAGLSE